MRLIFTQSKTVFWKFTTLIVFITVWSLIPFQSIAQNVSKDFLYDQKFIIDDSYENGDYVCTINLLRGKSDGSERFSLSGGDTDAFMINSSTGVITVRDATRINGPDNMQVTVSGTLNGHANNTCTIDIQVYTIQDEFFVATNGSNSNNGRSAGSAWATISYAVSQVSPGDKVWIRAGNYGAENVVTSTDGTSTLPIVYEGYKAIPGDIIDHDWYSFGDALNSTEMPLLDGGNRESGVAMTLSGEDYQYWKNIQIQNYHSGIYASTCTGLVLENILAIQFGSANDKGGIAFTIKYNTRSTLRNCNNGNCSNNAIIITGDYNIIDACEAYADEGMSSYTLAMDYYITIQGSYNKMYNCYAERIGEINHFGHGININGSDMASRFNLIKNCETNNTGEGFVVRKSNVTDNIIEDCKVYEGADDLNGGGAALTIRNGASNNTFRRIEVVNAWHGISFSNKNIETDVLFCGRYNRIEYCTFTNTVHSVVYFNWYDNSRIADLNEITNCVIDGRGVSNDFLFNSDRPNENNKLVNCIIIGMDNYLDQIKYPGTYPLNVILENCNFFNNGFGSPGGTNIISTDPLFSSSTDYHLQENSLCINAGKDMGLTADFDGIDISGLPDIGAFEYVGASSTVPVTSISVTGQGGSTSISVDNGSLQMNASVLPADATNKTVTWSVVNGSGQATINSSGLLQALSNGVVTVNATANDGSGVVGTLGINISNQSILVSSINVTGQGGATAISTDNGTLQMNADVSPSNASDKTVTWSVIVGTGAATISITGLLLAVSNGTVTVRATANDGSGIVGSRLITISNQVIPVTSISVTGQGGSTVINTDNGTLQMNASVLPLDATNQSVSWSVINGTGSATINSSGLLQAVSDGTVTVRATANDGSGIVGSRVITISNQVIPVTSISVTGQGGSTVINTDNGTLQMNASVLPSDATNQSVSWSVINGSGSATLNSSGLLQAVSDGTVTVRATANDGSGIVGSRVITISNQLIQVTSITVFGQGGSTVISSDNGTLQMNANVLPSNATNQTVSWSVVNGTGTATINSSGLLQAASSGTVTVRATANDGSGVQGSRLITISNQLIPVTSIAVTGQGGSTVINSDNGTLQMNASILPSDATIKTVSWSVSNGTGAATINSSGLLQAISNGTVTVRATANDGSGVQGTRLITISNQVIPVTSIAVTGQGGSTVISSDNGTLQMNASVLPSDATNKTVSWSIINGTGVATINSSGFLQAVSSGTVTVRATANDGSGVQGSITITISSQVILVSSISVQGQGGVSIVENGSTLQMNENILPSDATNKTVSWSVNNGSGQASINSSGLLQAISGGSVTVIATANDGSGVQGSLQITITSQIIPISSISVSGNGGFNTIATNGGTLQMNANVLPSNASNTAVSWSVVNGSGTATINSSGLLTAVSNGTVTVIATANDGSGVQGSTQISVVNQTVLVSSISVHGEGGASTIDTDGGTLQMDAVVLPSEASNKDVTWSIINGTGEADISSFGYMQATANGSVTVVATATDGSGIEGSLDILISHQSESGENYPTELMKVYPNPTTGLTTVETNEDSPGVLLLKIFHSDGQYITTVPMESNREVVDLSAYNNGMYILQLYHGIRLLGTVNLIKQ